MGAGMAQETGEPPGEPPGGVGALALVELESEGKWVTTVVMQTETAAAGDLVLRVGVAQETGEPPDGPPGEPPGGHPRKPPGGAGA